MYVRMNEYVRVCMYLCAYTYICRSMAIAVVEVSGLKSISPDYQAKHKTCGHRISLLSVPCICCHYETNTTRGAYLQQIAV